VNPTVCVNVWRRDLIYCVYRNKIVDNPAHNLATRDVLLLNSG
jgi:hypothetical protein